jgi:hypothetical protein
MPFNSHRSNSASKGHLRYQASESVTRRRRQLSSPGSGVAPEVFRECFTEFFDLLVHCFLEFLDYSSVIGS